MAPGFDVEALRAVLTGRPGTLKNVLIDQSALAGVGNAYSDEALHVAQLSPFKPAGKLTEEELARLHQALVGVLREAADRSSGLPASGLKSDKKSNLRVHGRAGLPCPVCGDDIREVSYASKSFQYCPTCQTGGKPLADRRMSRLLKYAPRARVLLVWSPAADVAQLVEHNLAKVGVAGSNPVVRSR